MAVVFCGIARSLLNNSPRVQQVLTSFHSLPEHYLKTDFGADAVRPKSASTTSHVEDVVHAYLVSTNTVQERVGCG